MASSLPPYNPMQPIALQMPTALGWDNTHYGFQAMLWDAPGLQRAFAHISPTPIALFNNACIRLNPSYQCLLNPKQTFWVDINSGSDSNAGTQTAPFFSMWKGQAAANATGLPCTIMVKAGLYPRGQNPWYNDGVTPVLPTVDTAWIAWGGRVVTGTFDSYAATTTAQATATSTMAPDSNNAGLYFMTVASIDRVADLINIDRFGNPNTLQQVATLALCKSTPDSFYFASGIIEINRRDGLAVNRANTRIMRPASSVFVMRQQINLYIGNGGTNGNSGFDIYGSSANGGVDILLTSPVATLGMVLVENTNVYCAGGIVNSGARAFSEDSFNGLTLYNNCGGHGAATDGHNFHNAYGAATNLVLTINCQGFNNGIYGQQSNNGWTSHDTVKGVDLAGFYDCNHGGTCRSINNSLSWLAGTLARNDRGDIVLGAGTEPPTAFEVDDNAVYWCDRTKADMPAGQRAYVTGTSTASIWRRNCWPAANPDDGSGTFGPY